MNYQAKILPDGLFVMIDDATGKFAASAGAETSDFKDHPEIAVLGWVLTDPMYKGHHLGKNVSIAAMHKCLSLGYRRISLLTDDFRIQHSKRISDSDGSRGSTKMTCRNAGRKSRQTSKLPVTP